MCVTHGKPVSGPLRKLATVLVAAVSHASSSVRSYRSTNRLSAIPCAIALYHGARSVSDARPCSAKSNRYGKYQASRDTTLVSTSRVACAIARSRKR